MTMEVRVAVCSRSFSRNATLRAELLAQYPQTTFNDAGASLQGESLIEFLRSHDRAIIALERIDDRVLGAVPELRVIAKYGVGLDGLDLDAMRRHGVALGWTPGVNRLSVAELALGFAIDLFHGATRSGRMVRSGKWQQFIGRQLSERTILIVGLGRVGMELLRLLQPFRCRVLAHDIVERPEARAQGVVYVPLEDGLEQAELVSLHLPLDASTRGILSRARLGRLPAGAFLVNTSRGGLVDEVALCELLESERLGGAAFDVFATEPPSDRALLEHPAFVVTPHIGGSALEAVLAMGRAAIAGLSARDLP